jgi:hypothetical protein
MAWYASPRVVTSLGEGRSAGENYQDRLERETPNRQGTKNKNKNKPPTQEHRVPGSVISLFQYLVEEDEASSTVVDARSISSDISERR